MDDSNAGIEFAKSINAKRAWPGAARRQVTHEEWEWFLYDLVRETNRRVSWWWGVRSVRGKSGAHCYVCGRYVATWPTMLPPSTEALESIERHKATHKAMATRGIDV